MVFGVARSNFGTIIRNSLDGGSLIWIESVIFQREDTSQEYTEFVYKLVRCSYWSGDDIPPRFPRGQKFHKGVRGQRHYVLRKGREYGIKASFLIGFRDVYISFFSSLFLRNPLPFSYTLQPYFFVFSNHRVFILFYLINGVGELLVAGLHVSCRGEEEERGREKREKFSWPGSHCAS